MNRPRSSLPGAEESRLRTTVATIGRELSRLRNSNADDGAGGPSNGLDAAWADLVEQLALGPEPEVRACPVCDRIVMRAATRCGYCWAKLAPLASGEGGRSSARGRAGAESSGTEGYDIGGES